MKARRPSAVVDHLFSRGVLGSMLVGTATGKVVEKTILIVAPDSTVARLTGWLATLAVFVALYVYWADFEQRVTDAADSVADAAGGDDG
mgnify:CR=1 FL=1